MFGLVLSALRARRTQTFAIFALTALAALGGSAAPWFMAWAEDTVAAAAIESAPVTQRVVVVTGTAAHAPGEPSPVGAFRSTVADALDTPDVEPTVGVKLYATLRTTRDGVDVPVGAGLYLGARTGICDQVRVEGACPSQPGEVMIGRTMAGDAGVAIGDELTLNAFRVKTAQQLRVSGIYDIRDVLSPYWAGTDLLSGPAGAIATHVDEAAFVTEDTLLGMPLDGVDLDYHLVMPDSAFAHSDHGLLGRLDEATATVRRANLDLRTTAGQLVAQLQADQQLVVTGVRVAALELVLLSWFALYLAVRQTSDSRRMDIGLLKLRGSSRWRIWTLTAQQSALPMLAGLLVGGGLGYASAVALTGGARLDGTGAMLALSAAVAAAVGIGSLLAAIAAELSVLRSSVSALMRRVPSRRRGWRGSVGDAVIAALAAAGVYQGYAERDSGSGASALSLLAPGLVSLAVALLTARLLPWLATKVGVTALRAGNSGTALSALNVARRPGTDRVFTVLAVCVGVLGSTVFSWQTASAAWTDRAALELGAPRVLVTRATNSAQLLSAVRAVDPAGEYAMAVAVSLGTRDQDRTLAVDASRLGTVAFFPDAYGAPDPAGLGPALHPAVPSLPRVHDGELSLEATDAGPDPTTPLAVRITLESVDGAWHAIDTEPLAAGRATYRVAVTGCGEAGCRLVSFELVTKRRVAEATLHALTQGDGDLVGPTIFRDISRWRTPVGPGTVGPVLSTDGSGLTITPYPGLLPNGLRPDPRVLAVDSPAPLPVLVAGDRPAATRAGDSRFTALGREAVPYQDIGTALVLPRLGTAGGIMDLEYARAVAARPDENASFEVWLTGDAPSDVVQRLAQAGVTVLRDTTVDDAVAGIAEHGPGITTRFQLFAALILLLLAGGVIVVAATVERRDRAQELRHLRQQGLPERSMRLAGYAATLLVVVAASVTGLVAASVSHSLIATGLPVFSDDWSVLPVPGGVTTVGLALAAGAALVVLIPAGLVASARVLRSVRVPGRGEL